MTAKQREKALQAAEKRLAKCNGDCSNCQKLHLYTATQGRSTFYAWGCDALPSDLFGAICNSVKGLKTAAVQTVEFELS